MRAREDGIFNCVRDSLYPAAFISPIVLQWVLISNERHLSMSRGNQVCPSSILGRKAQGFHMTTAALGNPTTSFSDTTIVAVATAVVVDSGDDQATFRVLTKHT